jgi:hypothetical protein
MVRIVLLNLSNFLVIERGVSALAQAVLSLQNHGFRVLFSRREIWRISAEKFGRGVRPRRSLNTVWNQSHFDTGFRHMRSCLATGNSLTSLQRSNDRETDQR